MGRSPAPHADRLLRTAAASALADARPLSLHFVCTGNICRSPTAHAVLASLASRAGLDVSVSSSGTAGHVGWTPDRRSVAVAASRGYSMDGLRGARLTSHCFVEHDVLLALDSEHYDEMRCWPGVGEAEKGKVVRLLEYAPQCGMDVEDPYYEEAAVFEGVFSKIEVACEAIVEIVREVQEGAGGVR